MGVVGGVALRSSDGNKKDPMRERERGYNNMKNERLSQSHIPRPQLEGTQYGLT